MKWINHKIVTGLTVMVITGNPVYGIVAAAAATLPDLMETSPVKTQLLPNIAVIIALIAAGGLFHIAEDALCGTVPNYKMRGKRWGKRFFRVNSAKEHTGVCLYSMAMMILYVVIWR